jgi:hypothetical protein
MRRAVTVMECTVAATALLFALMIAAQAATWAVAEQLRSQQRQEALEAVANVLETARAQPWESLNADWARRQELLPALAQRLRDAKLTIAVEPEAGRKQSKRVRVELTWKNVDGTPAKPVRQVSVFSARTSPGGKS